MIRTAVSRTRKALTGMALGATLALAPAPAHAFWDTKKAWNDLLQFAVKQVNAPGEFEIILGEVTKPEEGFALISTLQIRDSDGVWFDASNLLIDWSASALLRGRFTFETLSAEQITVLRAPIGRGDPPAEEAPDVAFAWPRPPVPISIDVLKIDRLRIEGGLLPQDIEALVEGAFSDIGDVQNAELTVQRTDRTGDRITLTSRIDFDDLDIAFELGANEDPGGLVAQMSSLPPDQALELDLKAEGTPDNLPFNLFADIGQIGIAKGDGVASWGELITARFNGTVEPGEETSADWQRALGEAARINVDFEETAKGTYNLKTLGIDSEAFELTGKGIVDVGTNAIDMALDWDVKDVASFNQIIAPAKVSDLTGTARATGALTAPKLDVNAEVAGLDASFGKADTILLRIDSQPIEGEIGEVGKQQGFDFEASAQGLELADAGIQSALGPAPKFNGQGKFDGIAQTVTLDMLNVEARSVMLEGSAAYNIAIGAADAELSGEARELGPFFRAAGLPIDGRAMLAFKLEGLQGGTLERLFLNAQMADLSSDDADIAAALGEEAVLEVLLASSGEDTIQVERGFLESEVLRLDAAGTVSVPGDAVDLAIKFDLRDAAAVTALVEPARIASATGEATLKGSLSEPEVTLDTTATGLGFEDYAVESARITGDVQYRKDRRAPFDAVIALDGVATGDADLDRVIGASPEIEARGLYDTATGLLTLDEAQVDLADADVVLAGDIHLRKQTLNITYDFEAGDLSGFEGLVGKPLAGSVDLSGSAEGPFTLPFVTAEGGVRDLQFDTYAVEAADLDISMASGADGRPSPFSIDISATNPRTGDPDLDALIGEKPTLVARGTLDRVGPAVELEILDADFAALQAEAAGSVDLGTRLLDLTFDVKAERLDGLSAILGTDIAGSVTAKGSASGEFSAPQLDATVDGRGLRYDTYSIGSIAGRIDVEQSDSGFAPFDVDIEARDVTTGDAALDDLLAGASTLRAKGAFNQSAQQVRIEAASVQAAGADVVLSGAVDIAAQEVDLEFDLEAESLSPFEPFVGVPLGGSVTAKGSAKGGLPTPEVDLTLAGKRLRYDTYAVAAIDGTIDIRQATQGFAPFDIDVKATGIETGDSALDDLLDGPATIRAKGGFNQSAQKLRVDSANLRAAGTTASLSGAVDIAGQKLDLAFDVAAENLSAFEGVAGADMAGAITLRGKAGGRFAEPELDTVLSGKDLRFNAYAASALDGTVTVGRTANGFTPFDVDVKAAGLSTGDPALDGVIGGIVAIDANGGFDRTAQVLRLEAATLDSGFATAEASGQVNLKGQTLDVAFDLDARRLAALEPLLGTPIAGAVALEGTAKGPFTLPAVDATVRGRDIAYDRYTLARLDGRVEMDSKAPLLFDIDLTAGGIGTGDPALDAAIGETVRLDAAGTFDREAQALLLDIARFEAAFASATAQGTVDLRGQTLDVTYDLQAANLSPFSAIAGKPVSGEIALRGSARGPFALPAVKADLRARGLGFDAYGAGALDGTVSLGRPVDGLAAFTVDMNGSGLALGDPALEAALGTGIDIDAAGAVDIDGQRIRLDRATIATAAATIAANGSVDLKAQQLDIAFDVDASDLSPFGPLAGADLGGAVALDGRASGPFVIPRVNATLSGTALRYQQYALGRVSGSVDMGAPQNGMTPFDVALAAVGITTGNPSLDFTLEDGVTLDARGGFDLANQRLRLDGLNAQAPFASVSASGTADLKAKAMDVQFALDASDLSPLSAVAGKPLGGALRANGTARGTFSEPVVNLNAQGGGLYFDSYSLAGLSLDLEMPGDAQGYLPFSLTGRLTSPRLNNPQIEAMIGETVDVQAGGVFDPTRQLLRLTDAQVRTISATVSAFGDIDLGNQRLDVKTYADIGDLSVAQSLAGKTLAGSAQLRGRVSGALTDPTAVGRLSGANLIYDTYRLTELTAFYDLQRLTSGPAGSVALNAGTDVGPIAAKARFDLTGGMVRVDELTVQGLGLDIDGRFASGPNGTLSGDARFQSADLALIGAVINQPLAGRINGTVSLDGQQGRQNARFDVAGNSLRYGPTDAPTLRLALFTAKGQVTDALGQNPYVDAEVSASDGVASGVPVKRLDATAKGAFSALDVTLAGLGGPLGTDRIETAARLNIANAPRSATVSRLALLYDGRSASIVQPVFVEEVPPGGVRVRGLDLRAEDGALTGDVEYTSSGIVVDLNIRNLPLALANLAGVDVIRSGRLDGTVDVDTRGGVRGTLALEAYALRLNGAQIDDPFAISANGTMDGTALNFNAEMSGAQLVQPLTASARIPLMPANGSPLPVPDQNAPFNAQVDWQGDIGEIWAFVPLPDHILTGPVVLRGRATGTLSAPNLSGGAVLSDGRYSNVEFGTLLTNLTAQADFTQDGRAVFELNANDGVEGTVAASGSYVVADGTLDTRLSLNNAALVRRDDATAILSGEATAVSQGRDIAIDGNFRTNYVEVRLIGNFGGSLTVVDAIPVGKSAPLYTPPPVETAESRKILLDVSLSMPNRVFVRGRGLDSEWGGQIDVSGTAGNPRVNGLIERRRGVLDFLGKQFELSIGTVRFTGGTLPFVQVRLQRESNDILGWIEVRGDVPDIDIEFGSVPALPEGEVLPRLLFGRSKQSLTALEAAQLAAGVATLLSGKAGVLDSVRDAVGVDVLRVESDVDGGTSVITGKYLRDEVFVGAKQNLQSGSTSGLVEIEIFDDFEIEAELGSEEAKGSVGWQIEY